MVLAGGWTLKAKSGFICGIAIKATFFFFFFFWFCKIILCNSEKNVSPYCLFC